MSKHLVKICRACRRPAYIAYDKVAGITSAIGIQEHRPIDRVLHCATVLSNGSICSHRLLLRYFKEV